MSKNELRLLVDVSSIEQSADGTTTGIVYWIVDGNAFPEIGWNDFLLVVLNWWCVAAADLSSDERTAHEMRFMDGPFAVVLERTNVIVNGKFVDTRSGGKVIAEFQVTWNSLRDAIVSAARQVCMFCRTKGIMTDAMRDLESSYRSLVRVEAE